jgi:hypothetical protein
MSITQHFYGSRFFRAQSRKTLMNSWIIFLSRFVLWQLCKLTINIKSLKIIRNSEQSLKVLKLYNMHFWKYVHYTVSLFKHWRSRCKAPFRLTFMHTFIQLKWNSPKQGKREEINYNTHNKIQMELKEYGVIV